MKNDGSKSEKIFEDKIKANYGRKAFLHRLIDTKAIKGRMKGAGFSAAAPSDYVLTVNGFMVYAEVKSCSDPVSFSFSQFTASQNATMVQQHAANGRYEVYIHNLLLDEWFTIDAVDVLERKAKGIKSMKWTEMMRWMI